MKKITSIFIVLAMIIATMVVPVSADEELKLAGLGTAESPYIIATVADLKLARDLINADTDMETDGYAEAHYKLTADLDLNNEPWTPIAPYVQVNYNTNLAGFEGTFDGNKHVIKNVYVQLTSENTSQYDYRPALGFFGEIESGTVKDLGIENVTVINDVQWVNASICSWQNQVYAMGGFAGFINRDAKISNCFVKNVVIDQNQQANPTYGGIGGFAGGEGNSKPVYTNCYVYNALITSATRGGITEQYPEGGKVEPIGAFLGNAPSAVSMTNCYAGKVRTDVATTKLSSFYGFANVTTNSSSTVINNCYSETDDIPGARKQWAYVPANSRGTVGATKEGIIAAMTAAGYITDPEVNDGYPFLSWEKDAWDGNAATSFAEGSGTEEDPYKIYTAAELKLAADTVNNSAGISDYYWFSLENDIDYEDNHWTPIGYSDAAGRRTFRGGFDGNGHIVKNLSIEGTYNYYHCGFFGWALDAIITDLGIENLNLNVTNSAGASSSATEGDEIIAYHVAGFAAKVSEGSTITGCFVKDSTVKFPSNYPTGAQNSAAVSGFVNSIDVRDTNKDNNLDVVTISDCYVLNVDMMNKIQGAVCGFVGMFEAVGLSGAVSGHSINNCYVDGVTVNDAKRTVYSFGYTGSNSTAGTGTTLATAGATVNNCYSTLVSVKGTDGNSRTYHENYDFGTGNKAATPTNVTKASITTAFTGFANWQNNENLNGGLPALAWEEVPVIYPYVIKSVSLTKGAITLEVNDATEGDKVYVATYDNTGRLISAEVQNVAETVPVTLSYAGAETVKVFIWNNNNPVIGAFTKTVY